MKWPVNGLEARIKASFRRLFKSRRSHFRRSNSDMKFNKTRSRKCLSQESHCPQCNSYECDSRWGDSQSTTQGSQLVESTEKRSQCDSACLYGFVNAETWVKKTTRSPDSGEIVSSKNPIRADASVNTDLNYASHVQDAYSQAELEETKTSMEMSQARSNECTTQVKPHMVNAATEPVVFDWIQNTHESLPIFIGKKTVHRLDDLSERMNLSGPMGQYRSEPFLCDHTKRGSLLGSYPDQESNFFFAGDSYRSYSRPINSSMGFPNCVTQSQYCQGPCLYEPVQTHEAQTNHMDSAKSKSTSESLHTSIPRPNWYTHMHRVVPTHPSVSDPGPCVSANAHEQVLSEWQVATLGPVSTPLAQSNKKLTKEYGDEGLPPIAVPANTTTGPNSTTVTNITTTVTTLSETSREGRSHLSLTNLNFPPLRRVAAGQQDTPTQVGAQRRFSAGCRARVQHGSAPDRSGILSHRQTISSRSCDREGCRTSTDCLAERRASVQKAQGYGPVPRRPYVIRTKSASSREPRFWRTQTNPGRKSADQPSRRSDHTRHNEYANSKEMTSKADKSERSQKKGLLVPGSTSDDGDQSKMLLPERSADISSLSSARTRQTSTVPITRLSDKRIDSKSPAETKKPVKQGGALPASRDLHQCPTGRHPEVKIDKPCICIMVKRMVLAQSKPVIYSWHCKPSKCLTNHTRSTGTGETSDTRGVTPGASGPRNCLPSLPNFQLARPTRMVRGGQGTVAWVSNVTTGQFYALKFKQREGRSNSTWEIERREAKLLRNARHEFIVRLYHIYETEETLFMALEWLDGGCLWNHIARLGTMPECYAVYYGSCILAALRYLHAKCIVYRDMKAENIVLDQRGRPKLIDFGMAKRFGKPESLCDGYESAMDESVYDSEDFDQPPTRYYFAAYLAPEIYDQSQATNAFIDSWGLGYILVEMILGYGIFLPMPWEKDPGQHLNEHWKLVLPKEASSKMSATCEDFLYKMLLRRPEDRLTLEQAGKHGLFARVPWSNLVHIRGPDLSKCPQKGSNSAQAAVVNASGARHWVSKYDMFAHVPDLAFAREFLGPVTNPNVICASQSLCLGGRRSKAPRNLTNRTTGTTGETRSLGQDTDKSRNGSTTTQPRNMNVGGAIEIRTVTVPGSEAKKDGGKIARAVRRPGVSAT